ncbi:TraR/DksA family transcriptional regulator [Limnobaculum zhutongyuii]|uniref:TraR/DksA family transcriptional regulator n=1 Tax=Limnobaculum zhutongyuii TaxID=2498113 RepID=A0A411WHQ3_9GAMM|nr:TraR/DksA family transcriptional regulator [Limnobaculum zhutongyuii]QBH95759.1 TraR/DksA family transcriptional regulator [Limnobaculum zhutongyuii]QBH96060.1 TraR/DksA family transcriptional regulator [Limnobaculum zhutongyuii]TQS86176.1 TraR/DksA family transcriptional regulator [Limnobaculum zhutongyuii]
MDDIDRASELETQQRERALIARNQQPKGIGSLTCLACGDAIPEKRRQLLPSTTLCVDCQQMEEKRMRR